MATDIEIIKARLAGSAGTYGIAGTNTDLLDSFTNFTVGFSKAAADGMASTATSETFMGRIVHVKGRLIACYATVTATGITGDPTNNATITVTKRDSAGANPLPIATITTTAVVGNFAVNAPKAMVVDVNGNAVVAALSGLSFAITKGGSGVVVPPTEFTLVFARI